MPSAPAQIITLIVVLLFALAAVAVIAFATLRARLAALKLIQRAPDKGKSSTRPSSRSGWDAARSSAGCTRESLLELFDTEVRPRVTWR